ncbi:MAG: DUF5399 family protein [Chlamydiia bacterium]|nr:DUF5399 family protein [Chlamydiia bacterium]
MSVNIKSKTIDDLGIDASKQYAENQRLYDPSLIEESRLVAPRSQIPTVMPYAPSEMDAYFSVGKGNSWALFTPPPEFVVYGENFFSYQLIPSLGPQEKQDADAEKLQHLEDFLDKERGKKGQSNDDEEEDEEQKERLIAMFQCLQKLDKTLNLINARRNQYQRG